MGLFEKRRCKKFFKYVQEYDPAIPKTHQGHDLQRLPFGELVRNFKLEQNTLDFIGHAVAMYTSDVFFETPSIEVVDKIKLYMDSIGLYGNSPFIYPIYGIGGIA